MEQSNAIYKSSGSNPVRLEMRASIFGPISSPSWKAKTMSGQPGRVRIRWEVPRCRLIVQPI